MASGTIQVTRDGSVRWSTEGLPTARVFVSEDRGAPVLYAEHPFGSDRPDFIQDGHRYDWTLATLEGELLDRAVLDLRVVQQPEVDRTPGAPIPGVIYDNDGTPAAGTIEQFLARPDAWLWIAGGALALFWVFRRGGSR